MVLSPASEQSSSYITRSCYIPCFVAFTRTIPFLFLFFTTIIVATAPAALCHETGPFPDFKCSTLALLLTEHILILEIHENFQVSFTPLKRQPHHPESSEHLDWRTPQTPAKRLLQTTLATWNTEQEKCPGFWIAAKECRSSARDAGGLGACTLSGCPASRQAPLLRDELGSKRFASRDY